MIQNQTLEKLDFDKIWNLFLETDSKFKETDKKFQETDRQMKNLMKKMSESESRWGRFVESLVEGDLINLLRKAKIKIDFLAQRVHGIYNKRKFEFDIIAHNTEDIVVVEVKTTLSPQDVRDFIDKMKNFRNILVKWSESRIYAAVAYISVEGSADVMAEKLGLFVIKATGDSSRIINQKGFLPKVW